MMTYKNTNRPDQNKDELVAYWRSKGCIVKMMGVNAGFDLLLLSPTGAHIVEIKNPRRRWSYTAAEDDLRADCMRLGIRYETITSLLQAAHLIGDVGGIKKFMQE